jgi:uncharacterized membrane protein
MSEGDNLSLYVATYSDATDAKTAYETLKGQQGDDFKIDGAVVMTRNASGDVDVLSKGVSSDTGTGAWIGGGLGLVVGLFAPPLLAATAIGAGIGALLGHFTKKHEEKKLGVELDQYFPPNSSAVVVIVDNKYLDRVQNALVKSDKQVTKAIDKDDYKDLQKALSKSDDEVTKAVDDS